MSAGLSVEAWRALRALVAQGTPAPEPLRERVAAAAREGEVVLLALDADPALAPWLTEPARLQLVVDGHLQLALTLTAEALARHPAGRVALLKGSASAYLVYARPALRFRRDVDLLVEDLPSALGAALAAAGFADHVEPARAARGPGTGGPGRWRSRRRSGGSRSTCTRRSSTPPWCHPSVDGLLNNTITAGAPLPITAAADTLVHTAIHLIENGLRQPLKHWVDLDRLARVDPRLAAERAPDAARNALWIGLHIAQRLVRHAPATRRWRRSGARATRRCWRRC